MDPVSTPWRAGQGSAAFSRCHSVVRPCQHRIVRMIFFAWNLNMFRLKRVSWKSFVFNKVVIFHGILRQDTCVVMWFGWEQPLLVFSFIFHFQTSKSPKVCVFDLDGLARPSSSQSLWLMFHDYSILLLWCLMCKAGRRSSTSMTTPWWDFVTSCTPLRKHTYYTSFTMEIPWKYHGTPVFFSQSVHTLSTEQTPNQHFRILSQDIQVVPRGSQGSAGAGSAVSLE